MWGFLGNIAMAIWQQMATRGVGGAHTLASNCLSRRKISTCGGHQHLAESLGRPGHCGHSTCHAGTPGQGSKNEAFKRSLQMAVDLGPQAHSKSLKGTERGGVSRIPAPSKLRGEGGRPPPPPPVELFRENREKVFYSTKRREKNAG